MSRLIRLLLWLYFVLVSSQAALAQFDTSEAQKLFDSANQERIKAGLPPLAWNDRLAEAAQKHAQWMANAHMLSHRVANEPDLTDRIADTHLPFSAAAENIAYSSDKSEDFHYDWMRSPGHRGNILSRNNNTLGVAVLNHNGTYYAVEDFAKVGSADSAEKAEERFAVAFNRARKDHKQAAVRVTSSADLRTAACTMADKNATDARAIPHDNASRGTIAFTASEPEQLAEPVLKLAGNPQIGTMGVGACFKATPAIPGGMYWFAVVY